MTEITSGPIRVESLDGGAIWHVKLATPKANVLNAEKIALLTTIFNRATQDTSLKAVLIDSEGPHFSFGASVEEHLPGKFDSMLRDFHALFDAILDSGVVTLAAIRGQCLGGALELAAFCHRSFASPDARLGQPEIVLGVFAPVASVLLSERIGRSRAEDLCLSGRSVTAEEALSIGLVDDVSDNPGDAALGYAREFLLPRSASSLRHAVRAVRHGFAKRFRGELRHVERLYVEELMSTGDAVEGLQAFLDKRKPAWSNS